MLYFPTIRQESSLCSLKNKLKRTLKTLNLGFNEDNTDSSISRHTSKKDSSIEMELKKIFLMMKKNEIQKKNEQNEIKEELKKT